MTNFGYEEQNLIRSFPFVINDKQNIPDWLVVDFRAMMLESGFDPQIHSVWLAWIGRLATKLRLGFRTDAPALADEELIFEVDISTNEFVTVLTESQPLATTAADRCGCDEELFCDSDFAGDTHCGPELLCDPAFDITCNDNLICDVTDPPLE